MARLITSLLVLAWAWACACEDAWRVQVHIIKNIPLKDLKDDLEGLRQLVDLTDEDLNIPLEVARCPAWMCEEGKTPTSVRECYKPVRNLNTCADESCAVWYSYTTRCGCGERRRPITWSKGNETRNKCTEMEVKETTKVNHGQNRRNTQPEVVNIHIDNKDQLSNLLLRVCPVRCSTGRRLRKVKGTAREDVVGGGVKVGWEDETCAFRKGDCECRGDDDNCRDAFLGDFSLSVTSCEGARHSVPIQKLHAELTAILYNCSHTTTTSTTTTTATTSTSTTTATTTTATTPTTTLSAAPENSTLLRTHNKMEDVMGETAPSTSGKTTSLRYVVGGAAGGAVGVFVLAAVVAALVWKTRRTRGGESYRAVETVP